MITKFKFLKMNLLYPLKFKPIILDKMWGGSKLKTELNKPVESDKAGESWEISGFKGYISEVKNGFLAGNNLQELIEVYMGDLVGDRVYNKFGVEFPLLIKFIEANDVLSIQVHPGDELAKKRHNEMGKTEMWYIMQADERAELIVGFNREVSKDIYLKHLDEKRLMSILNTEPVKEGDVFFLPAGRVHAIGSGILLAEIQQTSDLTYRIYDFDRKDSDGNYRELHTEEAVEAIDYNYYKNYKTGYKDLENKPVTLINCQYFTTNWLNVSTKLDRDISQLDSFVIYLCIEGACEIVQVNQDATALQKGNTILIPATLDQYTIIPRANVKLLEVFVTKESDDRE
ncbi:Mannose-6-phosphate isomerase ManA [subsurface metagenome]